MWPFRKKNAFPMTYEISIDPKNSNEVLDKLMKKLKAVELQAKKTDRSVNNALKTKKSR